MSERKLRIALAQVDPLVGDVTGNAALVEREAIRARDALGADVVVFPELVLTGYPPEDLLLRDSLIQWCHREFERLRETLTGITCVFGMPWREGLSLYNAAVAIRDGRVLARYHKQELPNYGVFDERRYFQPGYEPAVFEQNGVHLGLTVCEDIWHAGPAAQAAGAGAEVLLNLNASPFHEFKYEDRLGVLRDRVNELGLPIVYVNMVGGQDELVFDGESMVLAADGELALRAPVFTPDLQVVEVSPGMAAPAAPALAPRPERDALVWQALVTGVRDYIGKNGFRGAVLGLSGGIDSAVTLAVAVDALGAESVEAVMMPTRYTADISLEDAHLEAHRLGVKYRVIPIEPAFLAFLDMLKDEFAGLPEDTTEENIQARCRGVVLMAISNKTGRMLLTTGNKSEMAVGYATLYGDMAGGFAPLKDVFKTRVWQLARWRNRQSEVIPERTITRPPSAELREGQVDQDSLPPYEILDAILERFIEQDRSVHSIIEEGFDAETVRRVAAMVLNNEYKRRQAPPGVRITRRAFGKDRRYPITSGYRRLFQDVSK
ncbi:MAG: NAD+ synthase [Gammaproteobacteria bacterium]|nr:MAG: NAD+ synthase [Gammaproteobacteria bacterium]